VLDLSLVDEVVQVGSEESIEMTHRLMREEGTSAGISSAAAVAAAVKVAAKIENKGKWIIVVLPDSGDRYHSPSACRAAPESRPQSVPHLRDEKFC